MAKLESAVRIQMDLHYPISHIYDNLKKIGKDKISLFSTESRLEALEANWKSFQANHVDLIAAQTAELKVHPYFAENYFDLCETAFSTTRINS